MTRALVTGGAGFIGSHIAEALIARGDEVTIMDSLETGSSENIPAGARFIEGDIRDEATLERASDGVDVVFHQAALGSVPRSIEDPVTTHEVNVTGTLLVLRAAVHSGARRFVLASSSSVYGGASDGPVDESAPLEPRSPYAASKIAAEAYVRAFHRMGAIETVMLRYFNVYGPRQSADGPYAAVIPRFITAALSRRPPTIHGDGSQTRDFTFVEDVVRLNLLVATASSRLVGGEVFNAAQGNSASVFDVWTKLQRRLGSVLQPSFAKPRSGDVSSSMADVEKARSIGFVADVGLEEGLERTVAWWVERAR